MGYTWLLLQVPEMILIHAYIVLLLGVYVGSRNDCVWAHFA